METHIKSLLDLMPAGESQPPVEWQVRAIQSEQCLSYIAWNERFKEAILVDPKQEDIGAYRQLQSELKGYLWIGVIDTHTHADHISCGAQMAKELFAPLIMHALAPSPRVQLRISHTTAIGTHSGPLQILATPGHTQDSVTVIWGPFIFGGDTLLFGDTGRDDLPGGSAEAHYSSLNAIKVIAQPEMILLPGHDHKGGRASTWATQMRLNSSLTQPREDFLRESELFDGPAPRLLKESLRENFK
jgi:glyoxylase-like metal-dependent hydrolase (beta-lactamase superfamily II)